MRKRFSDFYSLQSSGEFIVRFRRRKGNEKKIGTNSVVAYSATHIHHLLADVLRRMEIRVTSISIFNEEKATEYLWIFRKLSRRMSCTLHANVFLWTGGGRAYMAAELHGNELLCLRNRCDSWRRLPMNRERLAISSGTNCWKLNSSSYLSRSLEIRHTQHDDAMLRFSHTYINMHSLTH